ncbi:unnamed protein product, partial [Porites lobata]
GLGQIPPNTSCTARPQQWHKPTQRTSNVPVLFKDILMIKHDYDADKRKKTEKRTERKNEKEAYSSCPPLLYSNSQSCNCKNDYLPGKHKRNETQTEVEASGHLFKKAPVHCFG